MASKGAKGAKRATDKGDAADWARKRLKDGADGRPGSIKELLQKISTLKDSVQSVKETTQTLATVNASNKYGDVREVIERTASEIQDDIEKVMVQLATMIMSGDGFGYSLPSRATVYVEELNRIVLKAKSSFTSFSNTGATRKVTILTRVLQLVHGVLNKGIHVTKRDLFYTDVKLFKDQRDSDAVLDDISCMLGCTRNSLHVVASEKGVVVGRLQYQEDGDSIDCTKMGIGGKAIPSNMTKVTNMRSDAMFVLLVEKDAAFMRLAEDRFYNRFPCIILTAKGQPDVASRLFLNKLKRELKIPVLALVDSDPYGLKILSVYMQGSKNMAYDSGSLSTPDIKWLGVRPSDLEKFQIPEQCRLDMTDKDIEVGKQLLQEEFITQNPQWVKELEIMLSTKKKAEIQALSSYGFQYLSEVYLPLKLQEGDWI
uniref:DNA topoisomerase (ATP-hydrolyzing) n=1 Tax=Pyramimonas obovata TaxID=1411642 RepID=A0A7S0WKQ0_9CHLO|mmetsp:Transcript_28717/g.62909  ORF Transcript_28717/g.62909 Transcript_28717/m.62909 type:complete len:428 (+) Transcript_28717:400-1683(+)|eukprot:CAMPEP_0118925660 /NCGR_PEP_ID=MMETSP1169-20130426/3508_1 /TAXON_ID=36882 /ORGANISM="Pyramimonas obovata, Strain CCMP722" /LENGTH=427 /DNA_ID=CAMNT_0006867017 /DNA_START=399 /DNA_END=1682 /DNA_ORIENTATION=+